MVRLLFLFADRSRLYYREKRFFVEYLKLKQFSFHLKKEINNFKAKRFNDNDISTSVFAILRSVYERIIVQFSL